MQALTEGKIAQRCVRATSNHDTSLMQPADILQRSACELIWRGDGS
jgi:hypothetical protein